MTLVIDRLEQLFRTLPRLACVWSLSLVLGGFFGAAEGAEVFGLYEAKVPVSSKDGKERDSAFSTALLLVVTKVSGERNPASNAVIAAAMHEPGRFVQQFQYLQAEAGSVIGEGLLDLSLWARFDARVVDGLVRDAGLPVWGRIRPAILTWLAIEQDARRELLGTDDVSGLAEVLYNSASQRGLSLILPLLDLEDRTRIGPSDVWAGFWDAVDEASARYQSESQLTVRAYPVLPTLWEARWRLSLSDGAHEWVGQADIVEILLEDGVHEARRYPGGKVCWARSRPGLRGCPDGGDGDRISGGLRAYPGLPEFPG